MSRVSEPCQEIEWRVNMQNGTSKVLAPDCMSENRICTKLHRYITGFLSRICSFLERASNIGRSEPRKVIHCFKVGMALSLVSLFYYMRPLYDGVGGNAMWAVLTVVVVFEYTVGATLSKSVNRATGTFIAGAVGVGVHWVASQSGEKFEPIILQGSVFFLAAAATFSRFIPSIKARFDYGAMIFILTFTLVSVSGYRVQKLFEFSHHRLFTIVIGTSICILTSMLFCPVWAGNELHNLIRNNMGKLADSLNGCVAEYFRDFPNPNEESRRYKCVLNSKATEESLANLARWEPAHGSFKSGHPWKLYLNIGASQRSCAYFIEALSGSIDSDTKAPDFLKKHFSKFGIRLSADSTAVLKELAVVIGTMKKSSKLDLMVEEMKKTVDELQDAIKSLSKEPVQSTVPNSEDPDNGLGNANASPAIVSLVELVPLVTVSSLLIEIAARIEKTVAATTGLVEKAEFSIDAENVKKNKTPHVQNQDDANTSKGPSF